MPCVEMGPLVGRTGRDLSAMLIASRFFKWPRWLNAWCRVYINGFSEVQLAHPRPSRHSIMTHMTPLLLIADG